MPSSRWATLLLSALTFLSCGSPSGSAEDEDLGVDTCHERIESLRQAPLSYDQTVACLRVVPRAEWEPFLEHGLKTARSPMETARIEHDAALLADRQGKYREALVLARRAEAVFRDRGETLWLATSIFNQGTYYSALGLGRQALDRFETALGLYEGLEGRENEEAMTLAQVGWVFFLLGDAESAADRLHRATELHTHPRDLAATLDRLGSVYRQIGKADEAEACYRKALEILEQDPLRGHVIANMGWIELDRERPHEAQELLQKALPLLQELGDLDAATHTLVGLANAAHRQGRLREALGYLEPALEIVESLRQETSSRRLSSAFLALRHDYYLSWVDLLVDLHRRYPAEGWDRKALVADEKRRARALLDALRRLPEQNQDPESMALATDLRDRIARLEAELPNASSQRAPVLSRELAAAFAERDLLLAAGSGGPSPEAVSFEDVVRLLDEETSVLVYSLGERRSLLFYLERDFFEIFELPPRAELEEPADLFLRALRESRSDLFRPMLAPVGERLSKALLGPVEQRLRKRLRIVRDGRLHQIPFAALPGVASNGRFLVQDHEIVAVPSLSAWDLLTQRARRPHSSTVAVLAPDVPGGRKGSDDPQFPPLTGVLEEVRAVQHRAGTGDTLTVLGRDAGPEALADLARQPLKVLHIAAHGFVRRDLPELSKLVLSDDRGGDVYLRLEDVFALKIQADLVVLGACESGVGEVLQGEGMVGMSHAFLSAGASTVLASLWSVEDASTAHLMDRFYAALLDDGASPAEALRQAQLSMLEDPEGLGIPFRWAAFELHGN